MNEKPKRDLWSRGYDGGRIHGHIEDMREALKSAGRLSQEMDEALIFLRQLVMAEELRRFPKAGRPPEHDDRLFRVIDDLVLRYGAKATDAIRAAMGDEPWTAEHKKLYDGYRTWKKNNPGLSMGLAAPGYDQLLTAAGARLTAATGRKQMDLDTAISKARQEKAASPNGDIPHKTERKAEANSEIPNKTARKEADGRVARGRKPANADNIAKAVDKARAALRRRAFGEAGK